MAELLIRAYSLVAQLSAARLGTQTGVPVPDVAISNWLQARLGGETDRAGVETEPLAAAAIAVTTAAQKYERAAKSDVE